MEILNLTQFFQTAIEKVDAGVVILIWVVTMGIKTLDHQDVISRFYGLIPVIVGIGAGFLIVSDWKNAVLTGAVHGAMATILNTILKSVFKIKLPGDKRK